MQVKWTAPLILLLAHVGAPSLLAQESCATMNLLAKETEEFGKAVKEDTGLDPDIEWLKHARVCPIGPFTVIGPAEGSKHNLLVTENNHFVVSIQPDQVLLFEGSNHLVASLADRNHDGRFDWLDYSGRDRTTGNVVHAVDSDLDGRTDLIHFTGADGSSKLLFQIEGEWLEHVTRDGQSGFVVDGQFVKTKEEAAARIRSRRAP